MISFQRYFKTGKKLNSENFNIKLGLGIIIRCFLLRISKTNSENSTYCTGHPETKHVTLFQPCPKTMRVYLPYSVRLSS